MSYYTYHFRISLTRTVLKKKKKKSLTCTAMIIARVVTTRTTNNIRVTDIKYTGIDIKNIKYTDIIRMLIFSLYFYPGCAYA